MTSPRRRAPRKKKPRQPWESKRISNTGGSRWWTKMVERVVKEEPLCRLRLPGCTGRSQTADHIHPRSTHPHLAEKRWNLCGSCYHCNTHRKDRPLEEARAAMIASGRWSAPRTAPALGIFGKKRS